MCFEFYSKISDGLHSIIADCFPEQPCFLLSINELKYFYSTRTNIIEKLKDLLSEHAIPYRRVTNTELNFVIHFPPTITVQQLYGSVSCYAEFMESMESAAV